MTKITFEYRHSEEISASVDPGTREVTFDDKVVTGKMWLTSPGRQFVEIFEREGKYYLEPAA
jgi:hypothetical protein